MTPSEQYGQAVNDGLLELVGILAGGLLLVWLVWRVLRHVAPGSTEWEALEALERYRKSFDGGRRRSHRTISIEGAAPRLYDWELEEL